MMIIIFSWVIAICVGMIFIGAVAMSMGFIDEITYFNVSNLIWYIGIVATGGLLIALIIDRIKSKKDEEKNEFKKY